MNFDEFKEKARNDENFRAGFYSKCVMESDGKHEIFDMDSGVAIIPRCKVNKYLERYACKSAEELEDTLWYDYGIFCKIID